MAEKFNLLKDGDRQLLIERYSDLEFVDDTDRFKCVRCKRIPIIHYFTNCGHLLCLNCKRIIDNGGFTCPQCNTLITNAGEHQDEFERRLLALRTKCPNTKYGCQLTINLAQIPKHIQSCVFTRKAALPALLKESDTSRGMLENLKLLREEMEVMKGAISQKFVTKELLEEMFHAYHQQLSNEMQTYFNGQMDAQKKDYNNKLHKIVKKVNNLETQMNETSYEIVMLTNELGRLQNAQDKMNRKLEDAMLKFKKCGNKLLNNNDYEGSIGTKREVNILFIGQVGVGKSTLINALVNYLSFNDLEEAKSSDLHCLIPCSFALTDENFDKKVVSFGDEADGNVENNVESSTPKCNSYLFEMDNFILKLIDAPSIQNLKSREEDELIIDNIKKSIAPLKHLHGVCILLKANEHKITASFEYCLMKLICHLHTMPCKHFFFVFTNCRVSLYRPGDALNPLSHVLEKLKEPPTSIEVGLSKKNIFCLDNEAFRYLLAFKNNIHFVDEKLQNFNLSWTMAVEECKRMMNAIVKI